MAADAAEVMRFDRLEGWPAPEEQAQWFGDVAAEQALLEAYRGGRMHHAWMLGGPKGIGKATLAFRLARFVLAHPDPGTAEVAAAHDLAVPIGHPAFRKVAVRSHPNLLVMERPYDEQNKRFRSELTVPEIRRTVLFFGSTAGEAGWRIAIVDPADDMNASAANALLKVLEEPPARALFLIVSHAPGRALATIRSRCRRLDLAPLPPAAIARALRAGRAGDDADIELAAALAEGSLRRAVVLLHGGGIDLYRRLTGLLTRLPDIDIDATHAFADSVSRRGDEDAWAGFNDLVAGWLNRRVRGDPEPDSAATLAPVVAATPLERWAEVWENLRRSSALADALNLDRKRTVLSILMSLARATRM